MSYRMAMMLNITPPTPYTPGEVPGFGPSPTPPYIKSSSSAAGDVWQPLAKIEFPHTGDDEYSYNWYIPWIIKNSDGTFLLCQTNWFGGGYPAQKTLIYKSSNNFQTYELVFSSTDAYSSKESIFLADDGNLYFCYFSSVAPRFRIIKSSNYGSTWTPVTISTLPAPTTSSAVYSYCQMFDFGSGNFLLVAQYYNSNTRYLYTSSDSGENWTLLYTQTYSILVHVSRDMLKFANNDLLSFTSGPNSSIQFEQKLNSSDHFVTAGWNSFGKEAGADWYFAAMTVTDAGNIIAGGVKKQVFVCPTDDITMVETTGTQPTGDGEIGALFSKGSNIFCGIKNKIVRSTDEGQNFVDVTNGTVIGQVTDIIEGNNNCLIAVTDGGLDGLPGPGDTNIYISYPS